MSTSRTLTTGDRRAGAHLEYVKRRRVLRLGGWNGDGQRLETIELPLQHFLERLDIDVQKHEPPRWYLLFAGQARPAGGTRDLMGVFESEEKARAAFHELRAERRSLLSWAQLVVFDSRGRTKPVCWFDPKPSTHLVVPEEGRGPDHLMGAARSAVVPSGGLPTHSSVPAPTPSSRETTESTRSRHRGVIAWRTGLRALSRLFSFRTTKTEESR